LVTGEFVIGKFVTAYWKTGDYCEKNIGYWASDY
jgi:hypothetical protein